VERDRREQLRRPIDQDRFTVAAALLRLVLAGHTGTDPSRLTIDRSCADCGRMHGKPALPGSGLAVSVSHAGDRVAVACGRLPQVGVDVEQMLTAVAVDDLVGTVLHDSEARCLAELDPARRRWGFFTYWTRKEAVLKTTGDGLRVGMPALTVSAPDEPPELRSFAPRPELVGRFAMAPLHPGGDYAAALGAVRPDDRPLPAGWVTEHAAAGLLAAD
jgi:4'-phosphopantetheinyl transferase